MYKLKGLIFALFLTVGGIECAFSNGYERALLDALVKNNTITQEEALQLAKESSAVVVKDNPDTRGIGLWGMMQLQFDYMHTDSDNMSEAAYAFNIRRLFLGLNADISESMKGTFIVDFMRTNTNGADYILDAYVSSDADYDYLQGKLHFGIKKVQFGLEENISCMKLSTIDTSIATRYFIYSQRYSRNKKSESRMGFGQRYVGIFWDGKVRQIDGLSYYLAVTNSMNNTIYPEAHVGGNSANPKADDSLNYWLTIDYTKKFGDYTGRVGVKSGYGSGANVISDDKYGAIAAINPYLEFKIKDDLVLWGEFITADVQYGKIDGTERAAPMSYNIGAEYRFDLWDGQRLGLATRFSQLFTDGRGVSIKDTVTYSKGASNDNSEQVIFNRAMTVYAGINWYIDGDDLKLQLGYEWLKFQDAIRDSAGSPDITLNVVRVQFQAKF